MAWRIVANGTLRGLTDQRVDGLLRGDARVPQVFMTGDGHRSPPFQWTLSCPRVELHFLSLMGRRKLCAHVEEHQDAVRQSSVPLKLHPLFHQGRIFGWELGIYKALQPVMEACLQAVGGATLADVVSIDRGLARVHALLWEVGGGGVVLQGAWDRSSAFRRYFQARTRGGARDVHTEQQYDRFLIDWNNAAMRLRTDANPYIGRNIQKVIDRHPDCVHLITCGDAHILHTPLQNYVTPPNGSLGVVDPSNM